MWKDFSGEKYDRYTWPQNFQLCNDSDTPGLRREYSCQLASDQSLFLDTASRKKLYKLDGVGPVENRPSTDT